MKKANSIELYIYECIKSVNHQMINNCLHNNKYLKLSSFITCTSIRTIILRTENTRYDTTIA